MISGQSLNRGNPTHPKTDVDVTVDRIAEVAVGGAAIPWIVIPGPTAQHTVFPFSSGCTIARCRLVIAVCVLDPFVNISRSVGKLPGVIGIVVITPYLRRRLASPSASHDLAIGIILRQGWSPPISRVCLRTGRVFPLRLSGEPIGRLVFITVLVDGAA